MAKRPSWQRLSWFKPKRVWKKYAGGRTYYLGPTGARKDKDSHAVAWAEWEKIAAELEAPAKEHEQHVAELRAAGFADRDFEQHAQTGTSLAFAHTMKVALPRQLGQGKDTSGTIAAQVQRFLDAYKAQVNLGNRSISRLDGLRTHLHAFTEWAPSDGKVAMAGRPIATITAVTLIDYHAHQAEQIGSGAIQPYTGHHRIQSLRQFIRWAWEQELVGLPRNIDSPMIQITVPVKEVAVWTPETVRTLYEAAPERVGLYVLLAANCAMVQKDIADLRRDEVDLKAGTLTRARSKTRRHANGKGSVPIVTYRLWKPTLRLLKKHAARTGDRLLVNENGGPLVVLAIKKNAKASRNDAIKCAFGRLLHKANKKISEGTPEGEEPATISGSFKTLRATSANLLEQHREYRGVSTLFLGHAPASVKERHYTRPTQELLDEAVAWLGKQYNLKG